MRSIVQAGFTIEHEWQPGKGKAAAEPLGILALWGVAAALLVLGSALNLKVRQLIANKGREPEDYEGVPE